MIGLEQVLLLVLGNAATIIPLFLWARSESRADHRHLEGYVKLTIDSIKEEMKDFHARLCAIEERTRK